MMQGGFAEADMQGSGSGPVETGPTPVSPVHASLGSRFSAMAERFPERPAVRSGTTTLNYAALHQQARQIAQELMAQGVQSGALVGLCLERGTDMVAAMLGVILAGAGYLPLDPSYPAHRVRETVEDAAPALILGTLPVELHGVKVLSLQQLSQQSAPAQTAQPLPTAERGQLAYVIYTSGSTGKPKGVEVTHGNVMRLLEATDPWFHFNEHDVWTMFHSFSFDFSVWELWGPLLTGGLVVVVPWTVSRAPEDFARLLLRENVTILNQTPTAFTLLSEEQTRAGAPLLPALRLVIFGGEALNFRALRPWFARYGAGKPELVNMYGITETTVHVTYRPISLRDAEHEIDSLLGVPIPDLSLYLLRETPDGLQAVEDGQTGEICIGGAGVARGYLRRPELTAARFVPDPFAGDGSRLYRSGDLARRRADGQLVYLGRADRQVKIQGFRIELGEVEAALSECPGVTQAWVLASAQESGAASLLAFFAGTADPDALRQQVAARLPAHMRPMLYRPAPTLPLTLNGKVDRDALLGLLNQPVPPASQSAEQPAFTVEQRIRAAWAKVLGQESFSSTDQFFEVGGTSLRLLALRTELERALNRSVPVTLLFEATTVTAQARALDATPIPNSVALPAATPFLAAERARKQREAMLKAQATRKVVRA